MSRILGGLRKVFCEQKRWRGWLLVLGSVIWRAPAKDYMDVFDTIEDLKDKDSDDAIKVTSLFNADDLANAADKSVVLNTAIVVEGGHGMSTFQKTNYADFDKIKSAYQPDMKNDAFSGVSIGRGKLKNYLLELRKLDSKSCIIRVGDNLHVGVEVCKDHLVGVLKGAYKDLRKVQGDKTPPIDLQLLTCCGMSLESERLVVDVDRYALRVDGISADINDAHSEIQQVVSVKGDAHKVQRTTQPIDRVALKGDLELAVGDLTTYDKDGQERPLSELIPQEIAVYKTLDLPTA